MDGNINDLVMAEDPSEKSQKALAMAASGSIRAIMKAITSVSYKIMTSELSKVMRSRRVRDKIKEGIMPYLYATAFLVSAGREIDNDNLTKVLGSIGVKSDEEKMRVLAQIHVRNHSGIRLCVLLPLSNAKETSDANIRRVVESMGVKFDKQTFDEVLTFIDAY